MICLQEKTQRLHKLLGCKLLFSLLRDSERAQQIEKVYHFNYKDLISVTGQHDIFKILESSTTRLFIDTGRGYNAQECVVQEVYLNIPSFQITFDLSDFAAIQSLRFDPLEDRWSKIRLQSIVYEDRHGQQRTLEIKELQSNGIPQPDGAFLFETFAPMFFLPITGAIQTVSMRGTWEMLPLAHVQHVFDTVRPHYAAQLFLDTGLGFNETQTMVMPVQGQEREIEFDLSAYRDLKTLRFDPLNDLTVLHLNSVQFMTADGSVLPVDDYQTNACYQKGNNLLFDTPDPNITFAAPVEQAQKVVISLEYIALGPVAYPYLLQEKNRQFIEQAQALQAKDTELAQQAQALQAKDTELAQQAQVLQSKDAELAQQSRALQERDQAIQQHNELIRRYEEKLSREIRSRTQLIQVQDDMIQHMENTLSWRITKPLRWLSNFKLLQRQWPSHDASWKGKALRFAQKDCGPNA